MNAENKAISICKTSSSIASVVGNVTYVVRNFIESLVPEGYFKTVHMQTALTELEFEKNGGFDYKKAEKPILIIKPRIELSDDTLFARMPDWMHTTYHMYKQVDYYSPVLQNYDNDIFIYSIPERMRIHFDIQIICSSSMQQINLAYHLKSAVRHKGWFLLENTRLETEVPLYFIKTIEQHLGLNPSNKTHQAALRRQLQYGSHSRITEKIKASSGNSAFFYMYSVNLFCNFEDYPQLDEGSFDGMISDGFRITNNLTVDFNCPMNYIMEINGLEKVPEFSDEHLSDQVAGDQLLNMTYKWDVPKKTADGKLLYIRRNYITDVDPIMDELDIVPILGEDILEVVKYARKRYIDLDKLFEITLYKSAEQVNPDKVNVLWGEDAIVVQNLDPIPEEQYVLSIYYDTVRVNEIISKIYKERGYEYHNIYSELDIMQPQEELTTEERMKLRRRYDSDAKESADKVKIGRIRINGEGIPRITTQIGSTNEYQRDM